MLTAIVGVNWGDEGKGRMVDLISSEYDVVARYQGGNNAGHTVVNPQGKFILNLLPSGILRKTTVNVMGSGMVIDLEHLVKEIQSLKDKGVEIEPSNLKVSHRAAISMPYHKILDILEEERLADAKYGSTRRGIAPAYSDRYMKKSIRMEDLLSPGTLADKVSGIVHWKNLMIHKGYGHAEIVAGEMIDWLKQYGDPIKEYICDTTHFLSKTLDEGKNVLLEAQLGALRDIDYGIYPYTTSSTTLAAYGPLGAGIPYAKLDNVIGVMKAYSSCVGEGPFTAETFGQEASALRESGGEYGAATGRPRRVGGFDVVASRYGAMMQGADCIALTKLDVLSYLDKIPVCVAYNVDGEITMEFPSGDSLVRAKPVYEYLDGFHTDISGCRKLAELPKAAVRYIRFLEEAVGCPVKYVSVGAQRDQYMVL
ncbi:MAG: adenylosuccinate synthase [Christensenellales bacterium]